MSASASTPRDAFSFSLIGAKSVNGFALVPAIATDALGKVIDNRRQVGAGPRLVEAVEDFLARYFAPGCLESGAL